MGRARSVAALIAWALVAFPTLCAFADPTPVAVAARLDQDRTRASLTFDLSEPVNGQAYALPSPDRIVVDLPEVKFRLNSSVGRVAATDNGIVKAFRFGSFGPDKSRIVIDLSRPACPDSVEAKPIVDGAPATRLKNRAHGVRGFSFRGAEAATPGAGCAQARSGLGQSAGYCPRSWTWRRRRRRAWRRRRSRENPCLCVFPGARAAARDRPPLQSRHDPGGRSVCRP